MNTFRQKPNPSPTDLIPVHLLNHLHTSCKRRPDGLGHITSDPRLQCLEHNFAHFPQQAATTTDELSDANLIPLPSHLGIKYVCKGNPRSQPRFPPRLDSSMGFLVAAKEDRVKFQKKFAHVRPMEQKSKIVPDRARILFLLA